MEIKIRHKKYNFPDFFVCGFPKCGTTAIALFLAKHPSINFSNPKETFYFCRDKFPSKYKDLRHTLKLFEKTKKDQLVGEGSVFIIHSTRGIKEILTYNPSAKFIVLVRDPADAFVSLYNQNLKTMGLFNREVDSISSAWRRYPNFYERFCQVKQWREDCTLIFRYQDIYDYKRLIFNLEKLVNKENIHYIHFNDILHFKEQIVCDVQRFLNLSERIDPDLFVKKNPRKIYRKHSTFLQFLYGIKKTVTMRNLGMIRFFEYWLKPSSTGIDMPEDLKNEVVNYFAPQKDFIERFKLHYYKSAATN